MATVIALLTLLPSVALAEESDSASDERGTYLAEAAANGTLTAEERQEFIADYHDLAAITPDGAQVTQVTKSTRTNETSFGNRLAGGCASVSGEHRATSTLGFTLVRWKHGARFCWNGTNVTSVTERYHSFRDVDITLNYQGLTQNTLTGVGRSQAVSTRQGHFRTCIGPACTFSTYPTVELRLNGNGTSTWVGRG